MTNAIQKFIAAAREIEGKTTADYYVSPMAESIGQNHIRAARTGQLIAEFVCKQDAEFIAFARNNLPRLLDALEKQAAALEVLSDAEEQYRLAHDVTGDGSVATGYRWDKLRQAGDRARTCQAEVEKLLGDDQ